MNKVSTKQKAAKMFSYGQVLMIGGFLAVGTPETLVDTLVESNVGGLTIITNDTAYVGKGVGKLIVNKQVRKAIVSHIGTNPETGRQMHAGELDVELTPQGSLAEKIRCGGSGLGGVLTPTGVGTLVEKGKEIKQIDGKKYLLELPLHADIALIKAAKADKFGNLVYRRSSRNFNPLMAMAADFVIVEADQIVETGTLDPDEIMTPGVLVNMIIQG